MLLFSVGSQAHEQYQFYSTRYTSTICKGFSLFNTCVKHVDDLLFFVYIIWKGSLNAISLFSTSIPCEKMALHFFFLRYKNYVDCYSFVLLCTMRYGVPFFFIYHLE